MSQILQDLSPASLTRAILTNRRAMTPCAGGWQDADVFSGPNLNWCVTDVAFPACNVAFAGNLTPDQTDAAIADFVARGKARNVPLQWWCGPDARSTELEPVLIRHGFGFSWGCTGMALDLNYLVEDRPASAELKIERVEGHEKLETWCRVAVDSFAFSAGSSDALLKWAGTLVKSNPQTRLFLGLCDGSPVATSLLFPAEGVAGLYFVGTLPEARNRGIGHSMTRFPLEVARGSGYRAAILHATEMGFPIYRSLGFSEYCRIQVYVWQSADPGSEH